MNADQASEFIGLPYAPGSFGPNDFNCWGLLHYVQSHYFGVELPLAPLGNMAECLDLFKTQVKRGVWAAVDIPSHGDGALLRAGNNPHVGVYLDIDGGGILHALEGVGVVFTTLDCLNSQGFGRTKYYRLFNECESVNSS